MDASVSNHMEKQTCSWIHMRYSKKSPFFILFFSLVIAHSFIVHMGILHPLQIGKELLYTQDSGQSNPANISVLIWFFFGRRYTPLASCKGWRKKTRIIHITWKMRSILLFVNTALADHIMDILWNYKGLGC